MPSALAPMLTAVLMAAAPGVSEGRQAAAAAQAQAAADLAFLRASAGDIAEGQRDHANAIARARGDRDEAGAA
ncbi:MAG TPA: hypothetical protein VLN08_15690, partial [Vicinamibacterales bacterium]|nr:hypothetical protein [Vicinamibacterales bacterium]